MGDKTQSKIQSAEDWKVVWDEDKIPSIFPPEIVTTSRRPDISLYSPKEKLAVVIELRVPAEENMAQRKSANMKTSSVKPKKQVRR